MKINNTFLFAVGLLALWLCASACAPKLIPSTGNTLPDSSSANSARQSSDTQDDYFKSSFFRFENKAYKPNIRTIQFHRLGAEFGMPILELGTRQKLVLSFDDLDAGLKTYSYTIIHCTSDWQPSGLAVSQYLSGFNDARINDYRYSFNTIVPYTHYSIEFPGTDMQPTISGNYLMKVYDNYDPDDVVITYRFMVAEPKVSITGSVRRATVIEWRNSRQEIDFNINHENLAIDNPMGDIKIVLMQNNRWDNSITGLKPLFVRNEELVYNYEDLNVFDAGNEFRNFDTRSTRYFTEHVERIDNSKDSTVVQLKTDQSRSAKRYFSQPDINGEFAIRKQEGRDASVEADYVKVNFTLQYPEPVTNGNIHVFGKFTEWNISNDTKMVYDYDNNSYKCGLTLKQGYYNYVYVLVADGTSTADQTTIEGSHYETENNYTVLVYHRAMGSGYDKLIGVRTFNSLRD